MTERIGRERLALPIAVTAIVLCWLMGSGLPEAFAQIRSVPLESYLRVEDVVAGSHRGRPNVSGYVYNSRDLYASRVELLVESLDASGQVTASMTASVYGEVPPRSRSYFDAPVSEPGSKYRVTVLSVEWRGYGGGG